MKKIHLFDTTLRDGEQGIGYLMNLKQKINIFNIPDKLKLDSIEVGMFGSVAKLNIQHQNIGFV